MSKKIVSLCSFVLTMSLCLFSVQVAQAAGAPKATLDMKAKVEKSLQEYLNALTKQIETQATQQLPGQSVPADSLKTVNPTLTQERCAETGHSHSQAKNHKGPCTWIVIESQTTFDSLTQGRAKMSNWTGANQKTTPTKQGSAAKTPKDSTKRKYPPYW